MRLRLLLLLAAVGASLATPLAGCATRIAKGDAAPVAPLDESDRASSAPSNRMEVGGVPEWLRIRLADYDAQPAKGAPSAVHALAYRGSTAYLVTAGCCDQLDPLLDARGVLICHPSGGFTGRGDDKCPAKLPPAEERREIWRHR